MIPGFNHNIKHKGRVYHIQTEDSGPKNPHIITHLFVGGNILASKKVGYADIVDKPEYEKTVRSMMEEQHKQMLRNLVNGVFDNVQTGTAYHLDGPAPVNYTAVSPNTAIMAGADAFKGLPSAAAHAGGVHPSGAAAGALPRAPTPVDFVRPAGGIPVQTAPINNPRLEPPPPEVQAALDAKEAQRQDERRPPSGNIFGEDVISEKSLDEVILGYLAEDLVDSET